MYSWLDRCVYTPVNRFAVELVGGTGHQPRLDIIVDVESRLLKASDVVVAVALGQSVCITEDMVDASRLAWLTGTTPDMELGHWVAGSMAHLGHLSRSGHRVILTSVKPEFFRFSKKIPKMQNVHLKC